MGYKKVLGSRNPADALTKHMAGTLMDQHIATVGMEARGGRADSAPTIDSVEAYTEGWLNKRVRFHGKISIVHIPFVGAGRKVSRKSSEKTKWHRGTANSERIVASDGEAIEECDGKGIKEGSGMTPSGSSGQDSRGKATTGKSRS